MRLMMDSATVLTLTSRPKRSRHLISKTSSSVSLLALVCSVLSDRGSACLGECSPFDGSLFEPFYAPYSSDKIPYFCKRTRRDVCVYRHDNIFSQNHVLNVHTLSRRQTLCGQNEVELSPRIQVLLEMIVDWKTPLDTVYSSLVVGECTS